MFIPRVRHLHFVGIGGIGMSGIAEVLLNLGYRVSGSDLVETTVTQRLGVLGGRIIIGHAPENVHEAQVVVTSSAVHPENPEVVEALRRKIPVIPRAAMLAELMRLKRGIAVAGAHGKTTTTSMAATILAAADLDPTAVIGGRLDAFGSNARLGQGEFLVAEADESDGSFIYLTPIWSVITNIDREHLDYYKNLDAIREAFVTFARRVPFYGAVIACVDDEQVRGVLPRFERRVITYGFDSAADIVARNPVYGAGATSFTVGAFGRELGRITMQVPGAHNVKNALAAIAVGLEMEIPTATILAAMEGFRNAHRRFESLGERRGIMIVDDYGHHPTEIRATLAAAAGGWPARRRLVAFQPHRFTRTRDLLEEFSSAFDQATELLITEIYPAGESPLPGIDAMRLLRRIQERHAGPAHYVPDRRDVARKLLEIARPGDIVITLGAGDIRKTGEEFRKLLEESE